MANSDVNKKEIPLIYASKEVITKHKRQELLRTTALSYVSAAHLAFYTVSVGTVLPVILLQSGLVATSYALAAFYIAGAAALPLVSYYIMTNFVYDKFKKANADLDKVKAYNNFLKTESVDLEKIEGMSKNALLEISVASLIKLAGQNDDKAKAYKKLYAEEILKSYDLPENLTITSEKGKKPYLDALLPYTAEYIKDGKGKGTGNLGANAVFTILLGTIWGYVLKNKVTWGLMMFSVPNAVSFVLPVASAFCFGAYDMYQNNKLYSSIAQNVKIETEAKLQKVTDKGQVYKVQDTFNSWLDKIVGDNKDKRVQAIDGFVERLNEERAAKQQSVAVASAA